MADVHDKKTRSYNMSRIKGKDTKPEILVRKFLFPGCLHNDQKAKFNEFEYGYSEKIWEES